MGEAFRRARARGYRQQEDRATKKWLEPNLLRLTRGTLAGKELNCSSSVARERVPVGTTALLLLDDDGCARVVAGTDHIGDVSPTSMSLLRAGLAEAGECEGVLTSLAVVITKLDAFDDGFSVLLRSEGTDDAA